MFAKREAISSHSGGQRGYSLIEIIASLLLIAAIAVLSLPTYQDFSPHPDAAGVQAHPAAVDPEPEGSENATAQTATSQPGAPDRGESTGDQAPENAEEEQDI